MLFYNVFVFLMVFFVFVIVSIFFFYFCLVSIIERCLINKELVLVSKYIGISYYLLGVYLGVENM